MVILCVCGVRGIGIGVARGAELEAGHISGEF